MRKNQQVSDIKEIQLSPTIQKHDIETKLRQSRNFIEDGDKVKIVMRLRGRMIEHKDIGRAVIENFISMMSDIAVVEKKLVLEERSFYVTLTKKK
jgi:translation initiation factor IF-3